MGKVLRITNKTRGTEIGGNIRLADSTVSRLVGLLGSAPLQPGEGLLLRPSSGVHTFGMRFPIDVVTLDAGMHVLGVWRDVGRCRIVGLGWKTREVLELAAGSTHEGLLQVGDLLETRPADQPTSSRSNVRNDQPG